MTFRCVCVCVSQRLRGVGIEREGRGEKVVDDFQVCVCPRD